MSEKRYQISPIELVEWAEPLFGDDGVAAVLFKKDKTAGRGFSRSGLPLLRRRRGFGFRLLCVSITLSAARRA